MADYYPLIARALDGLSETTPEMRRAVYDRARAALRAQLESLDPPLAAADITRERLALDAAIDRVEAEYQLREATAPRPAQPAPVARAAAAAPAAAVPAAAKPAPKPAQSWPAAPAPATPRAAPPPVPPPPVQSVAEEELLAEPEPQPALLSQLGSRVTSVTSLLRSKLPGGPTPPEELAADEPVLEAGPRERPRVDTVTRVVSDPGRTRMMIVAAVLLVVVGAIAVVAWMLRVQPSELQPASDASQAQRPEGDTKLSDRVAGERPGGLQPGSPGQASAPGAARGDVAVAQRGILYEENPADPQNPRATAGRALWRLDQMNPGQGQPLETVVRANVEVPAATLSLALLLRRNSDPTLPASHILELNFTTSGDPGRVVRDVGLLQLKNEEVVRGTPVAGLPVPVKDNVFLIGLSNLPGDIDRNKDLLLKRNWIDLPIRFASGQRAILSFEKGVSGDQALAEAFRQWQP
jgi:hypothetical protein